MAVFISYSSRDRALLDGVLRALKRAREQVWLDEELGGGESWWREILRQIRDCEVFIVALSKNALESKACQAELRYAQQLGKPVLPVQVGPLDTLRINPLSAMQVIDYRNPGVESGIELISSVSALRAKTAPLPDPLPEEPPIPFAYLMRLASTLSDPSGLSAQQQSTLLAELKAGLDEDGDDAMARRDIAELLRMLRDRSDVTWRTRTEVESVLASLDAPAQSAAVPESPTAVAAPPAPPEPQRYMTGPQPVFGTGQPPYVTSPQPMYPSPPMGPQGRNNNPSGSRVKWLIIGGSAVAVVAVVAVIGLLVSGPEPTPRPPEPPAVEPASVNTLLLTTNEVEAIMGGANLEPGEVYDHMSGTSLEMSNPACAGAQINALKSVYQGSGFSAVADQVLTAETPDYLFLNQSVVLYPSADQAEKFLRQSANDWTNCEGENITVTRDDGTEYNWTFDRVVDDGDKTISQRGNQEGMAGYGCEHTMRVVSNAVLETRVCGNGTSDEADRMAEEMAAKVGK